MWHRKDICILLIILITIIAGNLCLAEEHKAGKGEFAPFSQEWQQLTLTEGISSDSKYCCGSGPLRESPVNLSHLIGKKVKSLSILSYYPSKFDLRDSKRVPGIRDQGQSGSCWDFASMKSLESSLLPESEKDLSENNLKNRVSVYSPEGFDFADGGNDLMAAAYFLRGSGPVPEKLDPYNPYSFVSPENLPVEARVSDVPIIPGRIGPTDNENVKWALVNLGCLYSTLFYNEDNFNPNTNAYYCSDGKTPNHAISIVGWDDTYPASKFKNQPAGDGAFICANSWGTDFGDKGFFYVSYYDSLIAKRISAFSAAPDRTDGSYGYDTLGWVNSFGFGFSDASAANVFTAEEDIEVASAGFYIPQVGTSVTASVYLNPVESPVGNLPPVASKEETYQVPGYHSLMFDIPVKVKKGDKFTITVDFYTPDYGFPIPVEYPVPGYSSKATAKPGQSYVKTSTGKWSDLTNWDPQANVCIRAGYRLVSGPKADFYAEPVSGSAPLTVSFHDISTGNPERWLWQFGDGSTSAEQNPVHTYSLNGVYSVTLTSDTPAGESVMVKKNYITVSEPVRIIVPDDHSLIQEAINSAPPGSTILVRYGYYPEKLTINRPVHLIGESNPEDQKPIIDAQYTGTPVSVTAAGVTVENFSLTGAGSETAIRPAVAVRGNKAVIRKNWIFENYAGVRFESVTGSVFDDNIIWNSTSNAIYGESSSYLDISNNTIVWTRESPAIRLVSAYNSVVKGNAVAENNKGGVSITGSGVTLYDNFFNNTINVVLNADTKATWNVPKSPGPNIVLGPYIGGNFWAAPDGTGFSQTHPDNDGDGFCDEVYRIGGENVDELPLAIPDEVPPRADFDAEPRTGNIPLTVQFRDKSLGKIDSWQWDFGDGTTSGERNPLHEYQNTGSFDVKLTVTGQKGSDTKEKLSYITATGTGNRYILTLKPGWNFFTPPKSLSQGSDTAAIFASVQTDGHSLFEFSNQATGWRRLNRDSVLHPITGYWIYSRKQEEIILWLDPVSGGKKTVEPGWNAIGSPGTGPVRAKDAMKSLEDKWTYLVGYDKGLQRYEEVIIRKGTGVHSDERLLKSGQGYWLYATGTGDIYAS